jgi:general secretion pathway protein J
MTPAAAIREPMAGGTGAGQARARAGGGGSRATTASVASASRRPARSACLLPAAGCRLPAGFRSPANGRLATGFTLLEVLLATTLLALLMAGAYGGIQTALKAMRSGERVIERVDRVRTVQEFLRRQLARIMPLPYDMTRDTAFVFEGDRQVMRFVAPMPGYLSHGGPYVQTLALVPGNGGLRLLFSGTMLNGYDPKEQKNSDHEPVVLLDHIRDGGFAYRGIDEQGNLGQWTQTWDDSAVTPLVVQLQLVMQDGERMNWPTLEVPVMLDAGAARIRAVAPKLIPTPVVPNAGGGAVQ